MSPVVRLNAETDIEKNFFPHQMFNSMEAIITKSECSICKKEYGTCNHVKGKPYMGELCSRVVTGMDIKGISLLVDKTPANKMCRITEFSDDTGVMRDTLTLRVAKPTMKPAPTKDRSI